MTSASASSASGPPCASTGSAARSSSSCASHAANGSRSATFNGRRRGRSNCVPYGLCRFGAAICSLSALIPEYKGVVIFAEFDAFTSGVAPAGTSKSYIRILICYILQCTARARSPVEDIIIFMRNRSSNLVLRRTTQSPPLTAPRQHPSRDESRNYRLEAAGQQRRGEPIVLPPALPVRDKRRIAAAMAMPAPQKVERKHARDDGAQPKSYNVTYHISGGDMVDEPDRLRAGSLLPGARRQKNFHRIRCASQPSARSAGPATTS